MATNSYGFTYPLGGDQADGSGAMKALVDSIGPYTLMRFANASARDAFLIAPDEGMHCYLRDINAVTYYDGAQWVSGATAVQSYSGYCTAQITLTTSQADVPGCNYATFTTYGSNAVVFASGNFDFQCTAYTVDAAPIGTCLIDGVLQQGQAIGMATSLTWRQVTSQSWLTVVSPGAHSVKLQAAKNIASDTLICRTPYTTLNVVVLDLH